MSSTKSISSAAAELGSVSSPAKTAAARINGTLGGQVGPYRRVTRQNEGDRIYCVPQTSDRANWRDADAVAYHGTLVARRCDGTWLDNDGDPVDSAAARRYSRLKSIGITLR